MSTATTTASVPSTLAPASNQAEQFKRNCLLVEADPVMRRVITNALSNCGFQVQSVADCDAAELVLRNYPTFDGLVIDSNRPNSRGVNALTALRAIQPELWCVVCDAVPNANAFPWIGMNSNGIGRRRYNLVSILEVARQLSSGSQANS